MTLQEVAEETARKLVAAGFRVAWAEQVLRGDIDGGIAAAARILTVPSHSAAPLKRKYVGLCQDLITALSPQKQQNDGTRNSTQ